MATVTKADRSLIAALGPFQLEVIRVTSITNEDTISSKLAAPFAAIMMPIGDAGGTVNCSVAVSGKTLTLHDPTTASAHLVLVLGNTLF